jgi:phage anti-repressor protein/phage antirepressor YoqD-like protein
MNLIPITTGPLGNGIQTTDARNLHGFLDVGRVFAAWIQDRIAEYKFVEGRDFVVLSESGNNPQGGRPSKEYAITLEMAKELAMVERTDKGREARQYFIECERRLVETPKFDPASLTRMDILKMALDSEERAVKAEAQVITLASVVQDQAPKVEALARIATSDGLMCITDAAKSLQVQPKRLFGWLQQHQWIYRRAGGSGFVGYQNRIQSGCLSHKVVTIDRSDGSTATKEQVLVTAKGLTKLAESIDLH